VLVRRDPARRHFLLRDHRDSGRRSRQRGEDDQLGGAVGLGDRRPAGLGCDVDAAANDRQDRLARLARGVGQLVEKALVAQRGAIRMPPSSRTAAAFK
jgi:hypothetical protein